MPSTAPHAPMIALPASTSASCCRASHAERMQDRELAPAPQRRQRLRRVDEEAAGEQRHQRERREIRSIGARQAQRIVARLARRRDSRVRRQHAPRCRARTRSGSRAAREPQIDARQLAEAVELPLRSRDVDDAARSSSPAGGRTPATAQLLASASPIWTSRTSPRVALQLASGAGAQEHRLRIECVASLLRHRSARALRTTVAVDANGMHRCRAA